MRLYVLLFLGLLCVLKTSAQTETRKAFNGYGIIGIVTDVGVNGGQHTITMTFANDLGDYSAGDVAIGDYIWDTKCDRYSIVYINSTSPFIEVEVLRQNANFDSPATGGGNSLIYRPTTYYKYMPNTGKLNQNLRDCITNHLIQELDEDVRDAALTGAGLPGALLDTFDFNRAIVRLPELNTNIGVETISEYFEWTYFAPPTLTITFDPVTTVYEVGDTSTISVITKANNKSAAVLSSGMLIKDGTGDIDTLTTFGAVEQDTTEIFFSPIRDSLSNFKRSNYTFRSIQTWLGNGETDEAESATRTIQAVYPVFYLVSASDYIGGGDIHKDFTRVIEVEGDKVITYTGSGYLYYAIPDTWGDVLMTTILDDNGLNVTQSFTSYTVSVTSSGLVSDWTQDYTVYQLNNLTTLTNANYTFIR